MTANRWVSTQLLIMNLSVTHLSTVTRHILWTCQGTPLASNHYSWLWFLLQSMDVGQRSSQDSLHMTAWVSCPSEGLTLIIPSKSAWK